MVSALPAGLACAKGLKSPPALVPKGPRAGQLEPSSNYSSLLRPLRAERPGGPPRFVAGASVFVGKRQDFPPRQPCPGRHPPPGSANARARRRLQDRSASGIQELAGAAARRHLLHGRGLCPDRQKKQTWRAWPMARPKPMAQPNVQNRKNLEAWWSSLTSSLKISGQW